MTDPYLVLSDIHFHNFTAFSAINNGGINSRLQIQIDEVKRAVKILKNAGGDTIYNAGDTFHVRGRVETTVLNPVVELFKWIQEQGVTIVSIPGNHDLAGNESDVIGNAAQSLVGANSTMANEVTIVNEHQIIMFPWHSSVDALKESLEANKLGHYTAIIHAPVNGVIMGIPDHGLDAKYLGEIGFKRVFSGHYHNHKDFGNEVYSIGAMCHHTWSDVGSKAGFMLVTGDEVKHIATHAPQFIDVTDANYDDADLLVDGNYARVKIGVTKESDVAEIRSQIMSWGALGCVVNQIKDFKPVERKGEITVTGATTTESTNSFIKAKKYENQEQLMKLCDEIMTESKEVMA